MRPRVVLWFTALVAPVLLGLMSSAALLVDTLRPAPLFCAEGGGCDAVKHTVLAAPFGVPTPFFGMVGFALLASLVLAKGPRARRLHRVAAILGAIVAVLLILTQVLIGQFCPFCMVTDLSAIVACVVAIVRKRREFDLDVAIPIRGGLAVALGAVPGTILTLGMSAKVHLPDVIAEEMSRAAKGQATIVEFVDFECPFCRDEYDDLAPMLESVKGHVRVVRKLVPLTRIHPHALDAARAACCGDLLGQGDAMADALFRAPVEELTPEGCQKIAVALGVDPASYAACLADPKTNDRLALDRQVFERAASKGDGLPLLWIGERKMMGAHDPSELSQALDQAIAKAGS